MTNVGKVISIKDEYATISVKRKGACGDNCASCNGCSNSNIIVKAHCDIEVSVGDMVVISSTGKYVYIGLLALFLLPLIFPITMYLAFVNISEFVSIIMSCISLILSILVVFLLSKSKSYINKVTPKVISVID